jgi:hypothetical protein
MRTLLIMYTLVGALLGPPAAQAPAGVAGRAAQTDAGFLDIGSDPPARVIIDDADTKTVTPQPHLELAAGHHTLTLVTLDGARKRTIGFKIEPGKITKLTILLSK